MLVSDFNYELPEERIAQEPPSVRGTSRLLMLERHSGSYVDRSFADLPGLLTPGDLLVLNDSRVIPARLFATRGGLTTQYNSPAPSGQIEVLLLERLASEHNDWSALIRPAKKVQPGETLSFVPSGSHKPELRAIVLSAGEFGERIVRFEPIEDFYAALDRLGHLPLPPYIHRDTDAPNTSEDRERYQTVFAKERGSAAAPTAGLHFTPEILDQLRCRGIDVATITLHVGLGTFQPVRVDHTGDIRLHAEHYTLSADTAAMLELAKRENRRIVAVGTTTTRTLEHVAREAERLNRPIEAQSGSTSLFLEPGAEFKMVSGLLTNFHLPQSTLLMLVSAFAGRESTLAAYAHAIEAHYRFFSYGDCMLIL